MKIGIGIDTGGTYTDAVAYDLEARRILGTAKALTTRENLSEGILQALDALPAHALQQAELVSLSTTLATNACVEDRLGRTRLIFLGGDPRILTRYGREYGLPPAEEILVQESHTSFTGAVEQEVDWELFRRQISRGFADLDGVGIVEQNAMKNGAVVEKQAREIFQAQYAVPVVCGHELFSALNCLQRASSTLLNAGLLRVIDEFMAAIRTAMEQRGIRASVAVVRSDGTLMSGAFAAARPVETLLCGPAASVLGGCALSGETDCVVVDMGGTTTDLALLEHGAPVTELDGVRIGRWKTYVDGLYVKTFGLGGDSAIHYHDGAVRLEAYRVIPLCVAAQRYPSILRNLQALAESGVRHTRFLHEHVLLMREIGGSSRYSEGERRLCQALRDGPLCLRDAAEAAGEDVYTLNLRQLLQDGVVQLCGLTPTDIMHLRGDFTAYEAKASLWGARYVAHNLDLSTEALADQIYREIKRRIYRGIVELLLERQDPHCRRHGVSEDAARLIEAGFAQAAGAPEQAVRLNFSTRFALLGIGAPIHIFLPDVAAMLGTRAVIPEHAEVANALGAIVGDITAEETVEIRPDTALGGYIVYAPGGNRRFSEQEDAEAFARTEAEAAARAEALRRGAQEPVSVDSEIRRDLFTGRGSEVFLGAGAVARATGCFHL